MLKAEVIQPRKNMEKTKITDREQEVVFTNFTEELFYGKWAKKIYELKPKKEYYLPFYLAEHFAKHLVDRELGNMAAQKRKEAVVAQPNISSNDLDSVEQRITTNTTLRQGLLDKCVESQDIESGNVSIIRPREVPKKDRPALKTEQRAAELIDQGVPADQFAHVKPRKAESDESEFEGLKE